MRYPGLLLSALLDSMPMPTIVAVAATWTAAFIAAFENILLVRRSGRLGYTCSSSRRTPVSSVVAPGSEALDPGVRRGDERFSAGRRFAPAPVEISRKRLDCRCSHCASFGRFARPPDEALKPIRRPDQAAQARIRRFAP
jgi:hypothetical protein